MPRPYKGKAGVVKSFFYMPSQYSLDDFPQRVEGINKGRPVSLRYGGGRPYYTSPHMGKSIEIVEIKLQGINFSDIKF